MSEVLLAANELSKQDIQVNVLNSHTIKPLDEETILAEAKKVDVVVTVEEHQVRGGPGLSYC